MTVGLQNFFPLQIVLFLSCYIFFYIHKMLNSRLYNRESYALVEIYLTGKAS